VVSFLSRSPGFLLLSFESGTFPLSGSVGGLSSKLFTKNLGKSRGFLPLVVKPPVPLSLQKLRQLITALQKHGKNSGL